MSANPSREQSVSTSLHRVILGIGSAVLVLTMMVAYVTTVNILEQETLLKLELLMNGQSTADSEFAMAEDNISRLRDELLLRMASTSEAE
ncbi:MAG: hypothetical protein ACI9W1_002990, partial [Candidatus Azotimanducaceae bacterium]